MANLVDPYMTWDIRPWGTPAVAIADFNADGRSELLFLQTAGAHANDDFDPRVPTKSYKTGVEEQELFCMTLTDGQGRILWQVGKPWSLSRPFSWNGNWNEFCEVVDLDADGRTEIIFPYKGELRIYDGATGALRNTRKLPNQGFYRCDAVRTDRSGRFHILTKSVTSSPTHSFGNPSLLLDHNLDVVWEREVEGAGHAAYFGDTDGDGLDEILIGFTLFDHDGRELWRHLPLSSGDHLDGAVIADIDADGQLEIAVAHDGHDAYVHNADGSVRFQCAMHHCQTVQVGRFLTSEPGLQLLFVDKAVGEVKGREAVLVNAQGREISRHRALGYYSNIRWPTPQGPESFVTMIRPANYMDDFGAAWIDVAGKILARFNVRASFADHIRRHGLDKLHPEYPPYFGADLSPAVGDIDGDGRDELLINDRETMWVFRQP